MFNRISFLGILCLVLSNSSSSFAMGRARPSTTIDYQKISLTGLGTDASVTALKSGGYLISNYGGTLIFTDSEGHQTATAKVNGTPKQTIEMSDGTIAVVDSEYTLTFLSSNGNAKATVSDWGLTPMPQNHIDLPHAEWDIIDHAEIKLDRSGSIILATTEIDHRIEENTTASHVETSAHRGVARTYDLNGNVIGELQLQSWAELSLPASQSGFIMTDDIGKIYALGNDLTIKQQVQHLTENLPTQILSDIICIGTFADGGLAVGLYRKKELLIYGNDWSQTPAISSAIGGNVSLSSPSCTITSKQTLLVSAYDASVSTTGATAASAFIDERGGSLGGVVFKGQVLGYSAYEDGSFAIAYHPVGAALGLLPTPFLPIPFFPVVSPNEVTNKVNFAFFDANGKEIQTIFQAGSPSDSANYSDSLFIGKSGSNVVVSNGSTGYFVNPATGTSLGSFPGISRGKAVVGTDGTVVFVDGSANLIMVKLK